MSTYLLTWNPDVWPWENFADELRRFRSGEEVETCRWRCGNKGVQFGDRVFLMRQGKEPRGIMASGHATSPVYEAPHYDPEKAAKGKTAPFVDFTFDRLLDPESEAILPRARLLEPDLVGGDWRTRQSGILLPDVVAQRLEPVWEEFLSTGSG